ncbi:MAG: hypothetical protein A3J62_00665 [Candidatus Buchananbacteria bacterium RIFCSPHIGHO2_02_FULL_38_8]|uniref:Nudix hydrolase domain-containing protein n=2 Tax=Candidatus Buchananiibacteriota TaxID=1817903 RepID=A0A1G1Y0F0_9BACT|nr:MAG: hypothetical protein A2731_03690 [Candidatus Buchananbacteria bacterium RIFCSPHIGHO2_01_FULL_39_8]OGY47966.1 MAG: hypothetical protein A3J62_00665 [Candidatus Buchananbacteria bacterium RIFCSPHIGHO2_02_FULL_38_8]
MGNILRKRHLVDRSGHTTEKGFEVLRLLLENARMRSERLPLETWKELGRGGGIFVPVPIEMVISCDRGRGREIFLARRPATDPDFPGLLHVPGVYLKPGEEMFDTCQRIAKDELPGITVTEVIDVIGTSNNRRNPRFHDFSAITVVRYIGEPESSTDGGWYLLNEQPPENMISWHRTSLWPQIQTWAFFSE